MQKFLAISIDDHGLFRTGIELIVKGHFPDVAFAAFASLGAALEAPLPQPDVLLLDLHLDGVGGHDAIPLIKVRWPKCAIIVVTSEQDHAEIERARRQGADAVVLKSEPPERFISMIRQLVPAAVTSAEAAPVPQLSRRQIEVLQHLREGHSNKAIAKRLGISEFTVRGHVQQILKLFDVASRAQAVFHAQQIGLL